MRVNNDDEVYRVDAVWLGPPNATFPWRARYSSYGIGLLALIVIMFVQRRIGIAVDVFSIAWSLLMAVVVARFAGRRIGYERPLGHVIGALFSEVSTPRRDIRPTGGVLDAGHVRFRTGLPSRRRSARRGRRRRRQRGSR